MNKEDITNKRGSTPEAKVVLKCTSDDFRSFISGLLGKPQTILKNFRGAFDINTEHIQDLHSLITQRVYQQNKASLIQFTAKIVFSDNSSVLLNSFEEFMTYREVRPVVSEQLHISWSFLVEFQDKQVPEKQEVDISFVASGGSFPLYEEDMPYLIRARLSDGGFINFRIRHTARTWGADIEALLSGHIKNIIVPPPKWREFTREHSSKISFGVATCFFVAALFFSFWTASQLWSSQKTQVAEHLGDTIQLAAKVDYILATIASGVWAKYYFSVIIFLVISLSIAIALAIWVENAASTDKPSFVVLTEQARRTKERQLNSYRKKLLSFISSLITSILVGILSNYLFHLFWKLK